MLISIKQWETKYLRDFEVVKDGEITEERLYNTLIAMYYDYVSTNSIEPLKSIRAFSSISLVSISI